MKSEKDFKFPHKPTPSGRTASFGCSRSMIPQRDSDRILFQGYRIRRNFMITMTATVMVMPIPETMVKAVVECWNGSSTFMP